MANEQQIVTKQCLWCSKLKGGEEDSFKVWFTYRYKEHKNSTEEKTCSVCPQCVSMISILVNSILEYRESKKSVTSSS